MLARQEACSKVAAASRTHPPLALTHGLPAWPRTHTPPTSPVDADEPLVLVIEKFGTTKHVARNDAPNHPENDLHTYSAHS